MTVGEGTGSVDLSVMEWDDVGDLGEAQVIGE